MRLLYAIKSGDVSPDLRVGMRALAATLAARGASVLVAACTEAPLVLTPQDLATPPVNSTEVLAVALVDYATHRRSPPPTFRWTQVGEA